MFIHAFGAYFGLAVSMMHRHRNLFLSEGLASSRYTSDLFSLVSSISLLNLSVTLSCTFPISKRL